MGTPARAARRSSHYQSMMGILQTVAPTNFSLSTMEARFAPVLKNDDVDIDEAMTQINLRQAQAILTASAQEPLWNDSGHTTDRCPNRHMLALYVATGGCCNRCHGWVEAGENVMDCTMCNWSLCKTCATTTAQA